MVRGAFPACGSAFTMIRYSKYRRRALLAEFAGASREREIEILSEHRLSLSEIRAWALDLVNAKAKHIQSPRGQSIQGLQETLHRLGSHAAGGLGAAGEITGPHDSRAGIRGNARKTWGKL